MDDTMPLTDSVRFCHDDGADHGARRAAGRFSDLLGAAGQPRPSWWDGACLEVDPALPTGEVQLSVGLAPGHDRVDERFTVGQNKATGRWEFRARSEEALFLSLVRAWLLPEDALSRGIDGPRFSWRGLSLDVVRWPMTESIIHSIIDLLALHSFTVLHLHLTDHQGWRAPVPEAVDIPGRLDAEAYRRLLDHAERRYVTIVPEIDMPGHTAALVAALPDLAAEPAPLHPYLTYLDPGSARVRETVRSLVAELAELTPGRYVHLGGDEAFSMPEDLYAEFMEHAVQCVRESGKLPIAWQEVARSNADVAAAQAWTSRADLPSAGSIVAALPPELAEVGREAERAFEHAEHDVSVLAARGTPVIVAEQDPYYLDRRHAGRSSDPAQEERLAQIGFPAYTPRSLDDVWAFDPEAGESAAAGAEIAGVECALWTETVRSASDLALLLLPRLALVGERSFRGGPGGPGDQARRVLRAARPAWAALGLADDYRDEGWQ